MRYNEVMPKTPSTSFRLSPAGRALLDALARHYGQSMAAVLERLIREAARREGLSTPPRDTEKLEGPHD